MLARLLIIPSTVLGLLVVGYVTFTTGIFVRSYFIPAGSMAPAVGPGEMIFASGGYYASHTPVPGDIVLFNLPREGELTTFIKRVIAGPGDRIKLERGRLYLNGVLVERSPLPPDPAAGAQLYREILPNGRSYVIAEVSDGAFTDDMPEVLVEPGCYFVLGDNRDRSNDSRFPQFGTVPLAAIADKPSIIWMSRGWRRIGKRLQPNP
jgi:signal peptidase I